MSDGVRIESTLVELIVFVWLLSWTFTGDADILAWVLVSLSSAILNLDN